MDETASHADLPTLFAQGDWDWNRAALGDDRSALSAAVAAAITRHRWFGAKTRAIEAVDLVDAIGVDSAASILLIEIRYATGPAEIYQVPLAFAKGTAAPRAGSAAWIRVVSPDGRTLGVLYDALSNHTFCAQLLDLFDASKAIRPTAGELIAERTGAFAALRGDRALGLSPRLIDAEQSNSSIVFGDRLILKIFRRVEMGLNPDLETSAFLTRRGFAYTPPLAGSLKYRRAGQESWDLAMLQAYVPNQGDAWRFTLEQLHKSQSASAGLTLPSLPAESLCRAAFQPIPPAARAAFAESLASAELLGTRTAEMHLALSSDAADPAFAPQPFSAADGRNYFHRAAEHARETFALLSRVAPRFTGPLAGQAAQVIACERRRLERLNQAAGQPVRVVKIRCHGDYHLGQVLAAGGDFVIIDFEGEPARPLSQRREKQLALRDVAGMIRSFHYASCTAAANPPAGTQSDRLRAWTQAWYAWTSIAFLAAYRQTAGAARFLPPSLDDFERLLGALLLEKAIYELQYELNNRPDWVHLPLEALVELLAPPALLDS